MNEGNLKEIQTEKKFKEIEHIIFFSIPNIIGVLFYIPLLLSTIMGFGAPGAGKHWTHWLIASLHVSLGPLCLVALIFRKQRHLGWVGFALVAVGWLVVSAID